MDVPNEDVLSEFLAGHEMMRIFANDPLGDSEGVACHCGFKQEFFATGETVRILWAAHVARELRAHFG